MSDRTHRAAWIAILLVALVLRILYLLQVAALPFFDHQIGESAVHIGFANDIAKGHLLPSRPFFYASMLYPYFLAGVLALPGGNLFLVCLIQVLAGVLVVGLVGVLAGRLFGRGAGLAAGSLAALYGPFAFFEADVVGAVWALLALTAALYGCVRWSERANGTAARVPWELLLAGFAIGVAAVERPNLVLLVPAIAGWCLWRTLARAGHHSPRPRGLVAIGPSLALVVGAAPLLLLVTLLNFSASGAFIPLATASGINLYAGNYAGATGTYDEPWAQEQFNARHTEIEESSLMMASKLAGLTLTPQQASNFWTAKAFEYAQHHPLEVAFVTARKASLLLNNQEIPNHLNFSFIRAHAPILWLMPVSFGILLPLAVVGIGFIWSERRRRPETILMLVVVAVAGASVLPFFVTDRYRAQIVPPLLVFAGAGTTALVQLIRSRREWNGLAMRVIGLAAAAACFSAIPLSRPLLSRDYWMFAQAHEARGDLPAAATAYESAVKADGDDGELLNNLALTYRAMGKPVLAEATLRRAVAAAPSLAYPHKNLGMVLIRRGAMAEAFRELTEAVRLEPDDAEALGAVGALLAEGGDRVAAARVFAQARRLAPRDVQLAGLMSHYGFPSERVDSKE